MTAWTVERILAPNPGPFTGPGTNTYLLAAGAEALVIDPGPIIDAHHEAIVAALADRDPRGVLVTHTHPDHAPLAGPLARRLDVPTFGYAPGPGFDPDRTVTDGDRISLGPSALRVIHTPGHAADHLCFAIDDVLFTGDHIMGGSTVVVEDMEAYLRSLERLRAFRWERLFPGHGPAIDDPRAVIEDYIAHRLERERQILDAVHHGARSVGEVVERVYADVDPALHPLAALSVTAHLRKLAREGRVRFDAPVVLDAAAVESAVPAGAPSAPAGLERIGRLWTTPVAPADAAPSGS